MRLENIDWSLNNYLADLTKDTLDIISFNIFQLKFLLIIINHCGSLETRTVTNMSPITKYLKVG
jgi:hypothetical protein